MLAARIDRLPREEKELLQTLAAIGREFPLRLARQVAGRSEPQLDTMLAHLQSAEFVHEQPAAGDVEYIFKHALTQEVSYNSLLIEHRKLLHERIAEAIETLFVEHLDDHLKDLAHHYRRSNNNVKAIEYLRRAGEQSAVRAFYEEAIEQLSSALELLENLNAGKARDVNELAVRTALTGPLVAVRSLVASRTYSITSDCWNSAERVAIRGTLLWCSFICSFSIVPQQVSTKQERSPSMRWKWQRAVVASMRFSAATLPQGCWPRREGNICRPANTSNERWESVSRRRI